MLEKLLNLPGAKKLGVTSIIAGAVAGYCDANGIPMGALDPVLRYGTTAVPVAYGGIDSLLHCRERYGLLPIIFGTGYGLVSAGATMLGYGLGHAAARVVG